MHEEIAIAIRNANETKVDRYFRYFAYAVLTLGIFSAMRQPRIF